MNGNTKIHSQALRMIERKKMMNKNLRKDGRRTQQT